MAYGSRLPKDSSLYISGVKISGVQSLTVSQDKTSKNTYSQLGAGWNYLSAPTTRSISINRLMLTTPNTATDILSMDSGVAGLPFYGGVVATENILGAVIDQRSMTFKSGYVNSFSLSCGIGEIPTTTTSISVYGLYTSGSADTGNGNGVVDSINVPTTDSIEVSGEGWNTERIVSFNLQKSAKVNPIYGFTDNPYDQVIDVKFLNPIEVELSLEYEIEDGAMEDYQEFLSYHPEEAGPVNFSTIYTPSVIIRDQNAATIYEMAAGSLDSGNGAAMVSEKFNYGVDEVLKATRNYKWYEWASV